MGVLSIGTESGEDAAGAGRKRLLSGSCSENVTRRFLTSTSNLPNTYTVGLMGGSRRGARAPSTPMASRSCQIGLVLLALPVRLQNALKHA